MKPVNKLLPLLTVLLSILLTGCGATQNPGSNNSSEQEPPSVSESVVCEYTEALIAFNEPHGDIYQEKYAWQTQYQNVTYHFTGKISEEERNSIVNEFVRLISLAEERFGAFDGSTSSTSVRTSIHRGRTTTSCISVHRIWKPRH